MKLSHGLRIAALIVTLVLFGAVSTWAAGTTETAGADGPVTLNRLIIGEAGAGYVEVPFEDDIVAQEVLERFNVRLENEVIVFADAGEYNRRLTLLAAGGEWPELLHAKKFAITTSVTNTAGQEGLLRDMADDVTAYADPGYMELFSAGIAFNTNRDGTLYRLPLKAERFDFNRPTFSTPNIRIDILDELGVDFPRNTDEFYDLLVAISEMEAPDGSPMIPISLPEGVFTPQGWTNYILFNNWTENNEWQWNDDSERWERPVWSNVDGFVEAAVFFNRLYNEGLLDPETFIQKNDQLKEKMSAGRVGVSAFPWWDLNGINRALFELESDRSMFYGFMPPFPNPDTVDYYQGTSFSAFGYDTLSMSAELSEAQVEAFWTVQNFFLSEEGSKLLTWGLEEEDYFIQDGIMSPTEDFVARTEATEQYNARRGVNASLWGTDYEYIRSFADQENYLKDRPDRAQWLEITTDYRDQVMWEQTAEAFFVDAGAEEQAIDPILRDAQADLFVEAVTASSQEQAREIASRWGTVAVNLGIDELYAEKLELAGPPR